jgi:polyhydroxyalkanoate synthesis regulator phasin
VPQAPTSNKQVSGQGGKSQASKAQSKALVDRLTGAGEDALQRIADLPGGSRALTAFNDLRNRVDDMGKKVRGIDALEQRVAKLEKQVAELKGSHKEPRKPAGRPKPPPSPPTPPETP